MARRVASSGTAVSWIPSEAVELGPRGIFDLGIDAYDPPPPVPLRDLNGLHENGRFRTANVIEAWIDVDGAAASSVGVSKARRSSRRASSGWLAVA